MLRLMNIMKIAKIALAHGQLKNVMKKMVNRKNNVLLVVTKVLVKQVVLNGQTMENIKLI